MILTENYFEENARQFCNRIETRDKYFLKMPVTNVRNSSNINALHTVISYFSLFLQPL